MKESTPTVSTPHRAGFTLVELLTVIAIIGVLMGLLFPVIGSVQENARKLQAKNDIGQVGVAIKAFVTEYGRFPFSNGSADVDYGEDNNTLIAALVGSDTQENPRRLSFLDPPIAKGPQGNKKYGGVSPQNGKFYDPWGHALRFRYDGNYDQIVTEPGGMTTLRKDFIGWSVGRDGKDNTRDDVKTWDD